MCIFLFFWILLFRNIWEIVLWYVDFIIKGKIAWNEKWNENRKKKDEWMNGLFEIEMLQQ